MTNVKRVAWVDKDIYLAAKRKAADEGRTLAVVCRAIISEINRTGVTLDRKLLKRLDGADRTRVRFIVDKEIYNSAKSKVEIDTTISAAVEEGLEKYVTTNKKMFFYQS